LLSGYTPRMSYHGYDGVAGGDGLGLTTTATQQASLLYDQATQAFHNRDYNTALAKYQQAYALSPNPTVLIGIGMSEKALGLIAAALASFRAYLKAAPTGESVLTAKDAIAEIMSHTTPSTPSTPSAPKAPLAPPPPGEDETTPATPAPAVVGAAGLPLGTKIAIAAGVVALGFGALALALRKPKAPTPNARRRRKKSPPPEPIRIGPGRPGQSFQMDDGRYTVETTLHEIYPSERPKHEVKRNGRKRYKRPPRVGTRVVFDPTPGAMQFYSPTHVRPGLLGTVTTVAGPGGQMKHMPGPRGGLVYVKWDNGAFEGVFLPDIAKA